MFLVRPIGFILYRLGSHHRCTGPQCGHDICATADHHHNHKTRCGRFGNPGEDNLGARRNRQDIFELESGA